MGRFFSTRRFFLVRRSWFFADQGGNATDLRWGRHLVVGRLVRPDRTCSRYRLCRDRISWIRSDRPFRPRPEGDRRPGHWGPMPQCLHAVWASPPNQAAQYLVCNWTSQRGIWTGSSSPCRPWHSSGRITKMSSGILAFMFLDPGVLKAQSLR